MSRDPAVALAALVLILVAGAAVAVIGAQRAARRAGTARPSAAAPVRRGRWTLVLDSAGAKKIQVIKELRAVTGLGLAEAKGLTDRTPSTVLAAVDRSSAETAYRALAAAGATVRITEDAAPDGPAPDAAGTFAVVMDDPGGRPIQVIKEIRSLTGLGLAEAKRLTDRTPSTILSGVDHATATAAHRTLTDAEASVRIAEG